jgi:CHAT domain-containing protein
VEREQNPTKSPIHLIAAFDLLLRRKGLTSQTLTLQREATRGDRSPQLTLAFRVVVAARDEITRLALRGSRERDLEMHRRTVERLQARCALLEQELAQAISERQLEERLRNANYEAVALALPEDSALVEFVRFDLLDFAAVPARGEKRWSGSRYLAFVVARREPDDELSIIDLGGAEPIDQLIVSFRNAIVAQEGTRVAKEEPESSAYLKVSRELRAAVFAPLEEALAGSTRLFLSLDHSLCLFPFEVLPGNTHEYLIDEYEISYVSTGRDLMWLAESRKSNSLPSAELVAADPDFLLGAKKIDRGATAHNNSHQELNQSRPRMLDDWSAGLGFNPLPGTAAEGRRVADCLGVKPLLGKDVLESQLKKCQSPRILHIATHGFFLPDPTRKPNHDCTSDLNFGETRLRGPGMENPLLRSGLALAGAQTWLNGGDPPQEAEDGILTAEDVTGMDLVDTEMVVLSACDTGLGQALAGEGVFGLRRAFELAGARTLIMSMWKVPDEMTSELMREFYFQLRNGETRLKALRQAQKKIRRDWPEPHHWGAFILQGDTEVIPGWTE